MFKYEVLEETVRSRTKEREHLDSSGEFYYKSIAQFGEAFEK